MNIVLITGPGYKYFKCEECNNYNYFKHEIEHDKNCSYSKKNK
jgi:hypothetical protein